MLSRSLHASGLNPTQLAAFSQSAALLQAPLVAHQSRLFSIQELLNSKPDNMGTQRWLNLRKDIVKRNVSRKRDTASLKRHDREMAEQLRDGLNRVMSIPDKIADIEIKASGKVASNYLVEKVDKSNFRRLEFKDLDTYAKWKDANKERYIKNLKKRLTPHQFYISQTNAMERSFTGEYWWTNDVGRYDCMSCTQRLFLYEHKFINRSGYATFWNCIQNAVKYVSDGLHVNHVTNAHDCPTLKGKMPVKRAVCSNCESHLGFVFDDGPPPLGLRYQINSVAMVFEKKPWFTIPEITNATRRKHAKDKTAQVKKMNLFNELLRSEKLMGMGTYLDRLKEKAAKDEAERARVELEAQSAKAAREPAPAKTVFNIKGEPIAK